MTKKAATEAALGDLHAKVAKVMADALTVFDKAQEVYLEAEKDELSELTAPILNPALLSVMTKFLSDNKITCVPEESEGMSELEEKLRRRREKRSLRTANGGVVVGFPQPGSAADDED